MKLASSSRNSLIAYFCHLSNPSQFFFKCHCKIWRAEVTWDNEAWPSNISKCCTLCLDPNRKCLRVYKNKWEDDDFKTFTVSKYLVKQNFVLSQTHAYMSSNQDHFLVYGTKNVTQHIEEIFTSGSLFKVVYTNVLLLTHAIPKDLQNVIGWRF